MRYLPLLLVTLSLSCGSANPSGANQPRPATKAASVDPVALLRAGLFAKAQVAATEVLTAHPTDSSAAAVRAITRYQQSGSKFRDEAMAALESNNERIDHSQMRAALDAFEVALAAGQEDLVIASADDDFFLKLCLACWEHDWNHSGEIDQSDRLLFQVELDVNGEQLPDDDPRRRPTFRFDAGDVEWAIAMLSFQRATINLILAYDWKEVEAMLGAIFGADIERTVFRLRDSERVSRARSLLLAGLAAADKSRQSYLEETDDDHEWLPNPRQVEHSIPLPVDSALYAVWGAILEDLGRIVRGEDGLSVAEMFQLGDNQHKNPPGGFVNVGSMFDDPGDIVLEWEKIEASAEETNGAELMRLIFRGKYVPSMKASPLLKRMQRMARELDNGSDSLERKLRYFLWLN